MAKIKDYIVLVEFFRCINPLTALEVGPDVLIYQAATAMVTIVPRQLWNSCVRSIFRTINTRGEQKKKIKMCYMITRTLKIHQAK